MLFDQGSPSGGKLDGLSNVQPAAATRVADKQNRGRSMIPIGRERKVAHDKRLRLDKPKHISRGRPSGNWFSRDSRGMLENPAASPFQSQGWNRCCAFSLDAERR